MPDVMTSPIEKRKTDHLDLATHGDVGFRETTTLLEDIQLVHCAIPELGWDEVDTSVAVLGKPLRVPVVIAAMTGGTERARRINEELASVAEEFGCGFGLGSQRPMLRDPNQVASFAVRHVAPTALVMGNIGAVQAVALSVGELHSLVERVGADALCVHLNVAMELIQSDGDRDFRGVVDLFERLVAELPVPVIAKETGCGISADVARRLAAVGVQHVDVSGAGGTSWVAVEGERAAGRQRSVGRAFREWGIPTAASVAACAGLGFATVFATGGVKHGLEVAKALALGASVAGVARPVLQALDQGGRPAALELLRSIEHELRVAMLLSGTRRVHDLRHAPRVLGPALGRWMDTMGVRPRDLSRGR